jgi:hydroxyethylthiazole kinase-like uncharacterized protein yjeF
MKILNGKQSSALDKITIEKNNILSIELMNRAAEEFVRWFIQKFPDTDHLIRIFCGKGNNGGDGLAIGRILHSKGYRVNITVLPVSNSPSPDFQKQLEDAKDLNFIEGWEFSEDNIVIDAIFGTGLNRPLEGIALEAIGKINSKKAFSKIAVDIPSGLFTDTHTFSSAFEADYTFGFECPKLAYFMGENFSNVGEWKTASIGLDQEYLKEIDSPYFSIEEKDIRELLRKPKKYDHKGKWGHAIIMAGSFGKIGAAVLATKACLRSGCGLVTLQVPECGYSIAQSAAPEAMCLPDKNQKILTQVFDYSNFNGVGIGPGIGTSKKTTQWFEKILKSIKKPLVLDADALNILAENKKWWSRIPEGSLLTPHPKEFERWVGSCLHDFDRLQKLQQIAEELKSVILLKGAHTAIACPTGKMFFNTTGNPGMAKGGSGDILTGILTGLMASGYSTLESAQIGVWIHGFAGDLAAKNLGLNGMNAGDILNHLPLAFKHIHQ